MLRSLAGPTATHVWQGVEKVFQAGHRVLMQPRRGGATKEILPAAIAISDSRQRWAASCQPPRHVALAIAEVVWVMTHRNDLAFLEAGNGRLPDPSHQRRPDADHGRHAEQDEARHANGLPHRRGPQRGSLIVGDAGQD